MNFQPIIDQAPMILVSLGAVLWGLSKLVSAWAARDPAINEWDERAKALQAVSARYAEAIEWMTKSGFVRWTGKEKLAKLTHLVQEFESAIDKGDPVSAVAGLAGFCQDAFSKLQKAKANEEAEKEPLANAVAVEK